MKIEGESESSNVEDRRGSGGGGGGGMLGGRRGMGLGTIVIALAASYFFGTNPMTVMNILGGRTSEPVQQAPAAANINDPQTHFVKVVMKQTEQVWEAAFKEQGKTYRPPVLVLFTSQTSTACGTGDTASGPFYCPGDHKVYIDLRFYQMLKDRFKAPGDFAQAYVIAHEVGHHVQNILGVMDQVEKAKRQNPRTANALSVRLELQADCFAGIWARRNQLSKNNLEDGDLQEAMNAAAAVGDDRLQGQSGTVRPETFTHGSSAQRMQWFKRGYEGGALASCNTFTSS